MRDARKVFNRAGVTPVPFKVRKSNIPISPTDIIISKTDGKITVLINQNLPRTSLTYFRDRIATCVYWVSMTDGNHEIMVNISDGNQQSVARYRFSAASPEYTLLPDPHFFRDQGYAATALFAAQNTKAWDLRRDDIIWRGALNGTGHFSLEPWAEDNPGVIQRLRMAQKCKALGIDFKFVSNPRRNENSVLRNAGLTGDFIPTHDWGAMKYAIDIDGFTNAWCNLLQRLKLDCCVLKVASPFGYKQWYYDRLIPWEHFVPISADLSDLSERIEWVKTYPAKAGEIARQGQILAKGLTFESETHYATRAIEERERRA